MTAERILHLDTAARGRATHRPVASPPRLEPGRPGRSVGRSESWLLVERCRVSASSSTKDPGSSSISRRSRAVWRPLAYWPKRSAHSRRSPSFQAPCTATRPRTRPCPARTPSIRTAASGATSGATWSSATDSPLAKADARTPASDNQKRPARAPGIGTPRPWSRPGW